MNESITTKTLGMLNKLVNDLNRAEELGFHALTVRVQGGPMNVAMQRFGSGAGYVIMIDPINVHQANMVTVGSNSIKVSTVIGASAITVMTIEYINSWNEKAYFNMVVPALQRLPTDLQWQALRPFAAVRREHRMRHSADRRAELLRKKFSLLDTLEQIEKELEDLAHIPEPPKRDDDDQPECEECGRPLEDD